jgi:hypothetical protein
MIFFQRHLGLLPHSRASRRSVFLRMSSIERLDRVVPRSPLSAFRFITYVNLFHTRLAFAVL